jgi:hypothetical protein
MDTIPRSAGIGLLVYAVGTTVGFAGAGGPGGDYEPGIVAGISLLVAGVAYVAIALTLRRARP